MMISWKMKLPLVVFLAISTAVCAGDKEANTFAPIPNDRIEIERPPTAHYRAIYLSLEPTEGDVEHSLPSIFLSLRGEAVVNGLLPADVWRTDVSELKFSGERLTGNIVDHELGQPRGRLFSYTIDARVGENQVAGTYRFTTRDERGRQREGEGKISGIVKSADQLRVEQKFAGGATWPSYRGPVANFTATPTESPLVNRLSDARLVWQSEVNIPGAPGRSGGLFRKTLGVPTTPITGGGSTPIVADGKIFVRYHYPSGDVVDAKAEKQLTEKYGSDFGNRDKIRVAADDVLLCLDARSGEMLWRTTFHDAGLNYQDHKGSQNNLTPVFHNGTVFMIGSTLRLYAVDSDTGEMLWQTHLGPRHFELEELKAQGVANHHYQGRGQDRDFGAAPIVVGGVLVTPDMKNDLVGFNLKTGKEKWRIEGGATRDSRPTRWLHEKKEYVISTGKREYEDLVFAIDPIDGSVLWQLEQSHDENPIINGDLLTLGNRPPWRSDDPYTFHAYRLSTKGAVKLWEIDGSPYSDHAPVAAAGLVYLSGRDRTVALNAESGKVVHEIAGAGAGNAGHLQRFNDRLLISHDGKHGRTSLSMIIIGPKQFVRLDADPWRPPHPNTTSYHHPMAWPIVDGRLFIRGGDAIYCYDLRKHHEP